MTLISTRIRDTSLSTFSITMENDPWVGAIMTDGFGGHLVAAFTELGMVGILNTKPHIERTSLFFSLQHEKKLLEALQTQDSYSTYQLYRKNHKTQMEVSVQRYETSTGPVMAVTTKIISLHNLITHPHLDTTVIDYVRL